MTLVGRFRGGQGCDPGGLGLGRRATMPEPAAAGACVRGSGCGMLEPQRDRT